MTRGTLYAPDMRSLQTLLVSLVLLAVLAWSRPARADGGPFGLGLILGSPTGLSMKYYLGRSGQAIDAALGGSFGGYGGLHFHIDYLWHPVMLTRASGFNLPLHFGVGVRLLDHNRGRDWRDDYDDHLHLGIRVPVGITFDFTSVPLDAFFEIAVIPDFMFGDYHDDGGFGVDLNAAIGARYYF
jgi:hypothetical protein